MSGTWVSGTPLGALAENNFVPNAVLATDETVSAMR
jgi:hypothetical protein